MIISKLIGGLGNQMFQYAAGLCLSKVRETSLRLDLSALRRYKLHSGYQLPDIFCGEFLEARGVDFGRTLGLRAGLAAMSGRDFDASFRPRGNKSYFRQSGHNYCSGFDRLPSNCYLSGYWQSQMFFLNQTEAVRSAFAFRGELDRRNFELSNRIRSGASVSVHVRLGDYRRNPVATQFHGLAPLSYYESAVAIMAQRFPDARFFVFSDEPEIASEIFAGYRNIEMVFGNVGRDSYKDMWLMSMCKHHIIANSSFSWWGAWLGGGGEQVVIAPKIWFAGSDEPMEDIYLPNWIRL